MTYFFLKEKVGKKNFHTFLLKRDKKNSIFSKQKGFRTI